MNLKISTTGFPRTSMVLFLLFLTVMSLRSATVWNGPPMAFSKAALADPTQPENQDRITPNVWITRGNSQGIFNAKTESFFTHFSSPADTAWATGDLADYATLTYTDWNTWSAHSPPGTVGQNAVVHLISDDIYLSLTFTSWGLGGFGGGAFSYMRSTPGAGPPPPPAPSLTSAAIAPDGTFSFAFTNVPGKTFSILVTTNVSLARMSWTVIGSVTDAPVGSGMYKFVDAGAGTNSDQRHYIVRWP